MLAYYMLMTNTTHIIHIFCILFWQQPRAARKLTENRSFERDFYLHIFICEAFVSGLMSFSFDYYGFQFWIIENSVKLILIICNWGVEVGGLLGRWDSIRDWSWELVHKEITLLTYSCIHNNEQNILKVQDTVLQSLISSDDPDIFLINRSWKYELDQKRHNENKAACVKESVFSLLVILKTYEELLLLN